MNQTFRHRSALVCVAERGLDRNPGDYINAFIGIVGCVAIVILAALGVV